MVGEPISVLGAGGHSKVAIATAEGVGYHVVSVFDDRRELWGSTVLGYRIEGPLEAAVSTGRRAVLAIGSNEDRRAVARRVRVDWATLLHPSVGAHASVDIGIGTVVFAGAVLQPDTVLGEFVIVNTGATVDHDCHIGNLSHIAPGANVAGHVGLGEGSLIGIGASVMPHTSVGAWSVVGAGSVVARNIPEASTWAGVPAKPIGI